MAKGKKTLTIDTNWAARHFLEDKHPLTKEHGGQLTFSREEVIDLMAAFHENEFKALVDTGYKMKQAVKWLEKDGIIP